MPSPLYGGAQGPLMLGAHTALAPGLYLGPVRNVAAQALVVLVVNVLDVLHAEGAYPPSGSVAPPRTTTRPGTTLWTGAALLVATGASRPGSLAGASWSRSGPVLGGLRRCCGCCRCGCRHSATLPSILMGAVARPCIYLRGLEGQIVNIIGQIAVAAAHAATTAHTAAVTAGVILFHSAPPHIAAVGGTVIIHTASGP